MQKDKQIYVWSDVHMRHANILQYDNRPFKTLAEHDRHMMRMVECLPDNCTLIDFGDFSMGGKTAVLENFTNYINLLYRKNINLIYCFGNHCNHLKKYLEDAGIQANWVTTKGVKFVDTYYFKYKDRNFVASHHPYEIWPGCDEGSIHLHGHTHKEMATSEKTLRFCMSANVIGYRPMLLDDIIVLADKKIAQYGDEAIVKRH